MSSEKKDAIKLKIDIDERAIRKMHLIPIFIIITFSMLVTFFVLNNSLTLGEREIESMKSDVIKLKKEILKSEVEEVVKHIEYERKYAQRNIKEQLREEGISAYNVAITIYNQNRGMSKEEVKKLIKDALGAMRHSKARGYFYIYTMDLKNILLPIAPQLEGKDFSNYQDIKGDYVVRNIAALVREYNETFYTLYWKKPQDLLNHYEKITFNKYFEPFDWFIGTGEYVVDFENEIKEKLLNEIREIRYEKNGYIFMHDYDGVVLAHINKSLIGKNFLHVKGKDGLLLTEEVINIAKNGGGYLEYSDTLNSQTQKPEKKITYIMGINDWKWQIGTGVYLDDINAEIKRKEETLRQEQKNILLKFLCIFIFVNIVLIILLLILFKKSKKKFAQYKATILEQVENSKKQLIHMQQQHKLASMGEMLSNIAHQWRQPLNTITLAIGKMSLQEENGTLTKESMLESFGRIENSALYLSKTIDVFRNFFTPGINNEEFNVTTEIENTILLTKDAYTHNFIELSCDGVSQLTLFGDKKEFQQAIINILNNAKDAIVSCGIKNGKVSVHVESKHEKIIIRIQDNGGGIPDEIKDKIFEPYFTTKFKTQGTGIGMYMSKVIIEEKFGGTLSFENKDDGVEFCISINTKDSD